MKKFALSLFCALSLASFAHADAPVADEELVAQVQAALHADAELKNLQLDVSSKNGEVTLAGQTEDGQQLFKAALAAQSVPGVKTVKNEMNPKN